MTVQTLAYHGYIKINHDKIAKDVEALLKLSRDGCGFSIGFSGGFRSG